MKHGSFKRKQRGSVPGRKLLIAIVVFTSTLSFTLGYFVGKAGKKIQNTEHSIQNTEIKDNLLQEETSVVIQEQPVENKEQLIVSTTPQSYHSAKEQQAAEKISEPKKDSPVYNIVIYTVQAGAFKNSRDASALKRRLENKGYNVYIKKSIEAKNIKLFKVMVGEFTDKGKAEAVTLKLKRTEGLQTFVTPKNEK